MSTFQPSSYGLASQYELRAAIAPDAASAVRAGNVVAWREQAGKPLSFPVPSSANLWLWGLYGAGAAVVVYGGVLIRRKLQR